MLCSRTISCCSYRNVCVMMSSRLSSFRVSNSNLSSGVTSEICVVPKERKVFTERFLQHAKYFSTGTKPMSLSNNILPAKPHDIEGEEFKTIYRHPNIAIFALISKIKSVFYAVAVGDIVYGCLTFQSPNMNPTIYVTGFVLTMMATIGITVYSQYVSRIVGIIRVHDKTQKVKVSHLTFMGSRRDIYLDAEDIVPLLEIAYTDDNKVPFCTRDDTVNLYMSFVKGAVLDHDRFYKLFR